MPIPPSTGVTIGDVKMWAYTGPPLDSQGVDWGLTGLDGWFDGWESGTGAGVQQKSYADGTWVSPQYAGARLIHIDGSIEAESWDDATRAWDRLLAQIPFRDFAQMRVSTGEGTVGEQVIMIRQEGKPILTERFKGRADFSLSLLAPDPRRYDATSRSASLQLPSSSGGLVWPVTYPVTWSGVASNSTVTLINDGTWDTPPTFLITGPCPPCRITNLTTNQSMRIMEAVPAGKTLLVDVANNVATTDGQSRRVLGSWWHLVPGANTVAFSSDDGYDAAANLLITFRSAWK